jgi:hypothetical protein
LTSLGAWEALGSHSLVLCHFLTFKVAHTTQPSQIF